MGLIISGLVPVAPGVDPSILQAPGLSCFPRIDGSRSALAGWRDLADSIHAHGARFFVQLSAGLGRVGSPECAPARWRLPVSASWNPNFYVPQIPCRPLTDRECRKLVRAAGQAAADAKACGIDGVQLHGHEGYLLEQFANTAFNRRRFGRYADWRAFGLDMVTEIRRRCGPLFPIMYRIDLALALGETYGARMNDIAKLRRFRNERSVAMSLDYIRNLIAAGVDIIDADAVVCCTGSNPIRLAIAGSEARKMIAATDLLLTPSLADSAKNVVVIGGGDVGCETAHMLAYEYGKTVTVIESSPYFMGAACTANRGYLIHYLEKKGVAL